MDDVNAVLLFILVWAFTAVCQAGDDVISVSCEDVTGTVGEEVTLSSSVSQECTERCIIQYKFINPERGSEICREEFPRGSCEQRNSFTCRFTPTTAMPRQFRFFVQTQCGIKTAGFTVNITETSTPETDTGDHHMPEGNYEDPGKKDPGFIAHIVTGAVVVGFIVICIIMMAIFCVKRFKRNSPSGVRMKYEKGASAEPTMMAVNYI